MQQSASLTASRTTCCTTNAQLIEVMESGTYAASNRQESRRVNVDSMSEINAARNLDYCTYTGVAKVKLTNATSKN